MRQVICNEMPSLSGEILLEGEVCKHLALVLRKKAGECLKVRIPSGALLEARIIEISSYFVRCSVVSVLESPLDNYPIFVLLQWELKGDKMSAVIRQATEIGTSHIMPIIGEYSVPRNKSTKEKLRREKIICSAREQSGSAINTMLFQSNFLKECLEKLAHMLKDKKVCKLFAYERNCYDSGNVFSLVEGNEDAIVICVGAEGGISRKECLLLLENGFLPIHFNTNILKAETAAIYALASLKEAYFSKKYAGMSR